MKNVFFLIVIILCCFVSGCHKTTIGYLITENASYEPDTMYIRKNPIWEFDSIRIKNKAPWVSLQLQGYEGTEVIYFDVESVTFVEETPTSQGIQASKTFMDELSIRSGGVLLYPFENTAIPGSYKISIRISNPGYSHVLQDVMTIIVLE